MPPGPARPHSFACTHSSPFIPIHTHSSTFTPIHPTPQSHSIHQALPPAGCDWPKITLHLARAPNHRHHSQLPSLGRGLDADARLPAAITCSHPWRVESRGCWARRAREDGGPYSPPKGRPLVRLAGARLLCAPLPGASRPFRTCTSTVLRRIHPARTCAVHDAVSRRLGCNISCVPRRGQTWAARQQPNLELGWVEPTPCAAWTLWRRAPRSALAG